MVLICLTFLFFVYSKFSNTIPPGFIPYQIPKEFSVMEFEKDEKRQEKSVTNFGHDLLLSIINAEKTDVSVVISPLSINLALSMVASGSTDKTLLEFVDVLHLSDVNSSSAILNFQGTLTDGIRKKKSVLPYNIANSIWISSTFEVYKAFLSSVTSSFNSKVEVADFSSSKIVGEINSWISDQTNGLIKKVVNQIKKDEEMLLINTVYFNKKWARQFKPSMSKEANFTLVNGDTKRTMFMHASEKYAYFADNEVEAAVLRFEQEPQQPPQKTVSMLVILPKVRGNEALVQAADKYLSLERLSDVLKSVRSTKLNLALPRFKLSFSRSLKNTLVSLGLRSAFDNTAQFAYISKTPLKISDVIHEAVLRVDENGVEAAAATVVKMARLVGMVEHDMPIPFVLNRPFVCALLDGEMTFFSGIVRNVDESGKHEL